MARGIPSLRANVFSVASALANFESCTSFPFTAETILSRSISAGTTSMVFMATSKYLSLIRFQPRSPTKLNAASPSSHVLIDEDRVAVGVHGDETGRAGRLLIGLVHQLDSLRLELALEL